MTPNGEQVPAAHARTAERIRETLAAGGWILTCDIPKGYGRVPLAAALIAVSSARGIYLAGTEALALQAARGLASTRRFETMTIRQAWTRARAGGDGPALALLDDVMPEDRSLISHLSDRWPGTAMVMFESPRRASGFLVDGAFQVRTVVQRSKPL